MAPTIFTIIFDNPTNSYYPGTVVTGKVVLTLNKPTKARGLKVKFVGAAQVSWHETRTRRIGRKDNIHNRIHYYSNEEYFSNSYYLLGSADDEIEIPPGEHHYFFTTTLPPALPSSFNGQYGNVTYSVTAKVNRPWKFDYEVVGEFNIVNSVNLNYNPSIKEPCRKEMSKTFCCWYCRSGPLSMIVTVPFTGVVSGQKFPVAIEVDNSSNVDAQSVDCKLIKEIRYIARSPRNYEKVQSAELVNISCEGIEKGKSKIWTENIAVPRVHRDDLEACSIINVTFVLKVEAVVSGMHTNLSSEIPIILGTEPIHYVNPFLDSQYH